MHPTLFAVCLDEILPGRSVYALHAVIAATQKHSADGIYS